jgi:MFS family permease
MRASFDLGFLMAGGKALLFADRNFRWHVAGSFANMIGDQFTILALPWLVIQTTGDPLKVGVVIGASAAPRLIFLLFGGAIVDHYSAKQVLFVGRIFNAVLLCGFGVAVAVGRAPLSLIYAFALTSGMMSAFYIPAARSILREVVPIERLGAANSFIEALRQGTLCVAPLVAGVLIATFGDGTRVSHGSLLGLGLAFFIDGLTFAISAVTLAQVHVAKRTTETARVPSMFTLVREGLAYSWGDSRLRVIMIYAVITNLCASGPIAVAIPILAKAVGRGAEALGILTGGIGVGSMLGILLAGMRPQWSMGRLGATMLLADGTIGLLFLAVGQVDSLWLAAALLTIVGMLVGYQQLLISTWLQSYVKGSMIGRVLSLLMVISIGVAPFSGVLVGWLARSVTVQTLFSGVGILLALIVSVAWLLSPMRMRLAASQNSGAA